MASSGLQIVGFLLALSGLSATIAATFMVEWTMESQGNHKIYEGLWMGCSVDEKTICDTHDSLFKVSEDIQVTRSVMLLSIILTGSGLLMSILGMKCTRFLDEKIETKARTAVTGGIILIV
uniref:Claudin n=1 Tax=Neogobius melanostomus TaxID=47308 RepID=A0A8C6U4Q4_9GOBI